jgi:threonylcarbamoyladenosine tRNA methylthiotransferase MtaB
MIKPCCRSGSGSANSGFAFSFLMPSKTFHIETLGCRTNQADSAALQRQLQERNYCPAPAKEANLLLVNTCTVTHRADQDSRQIIRKLRRANASARLIVTGCYAQRAAQELFRIEGVHCIVPAVCREQIPELVANIEQEDSPRCALAANATPGKRLQSLETYATAGAGRTRPFVKIQDGCDARCSYCIVPLVRGPARSVPFDSVLQRVRQLIEEGYQEIMLTGIHLGAYGRKLDSKSTLVQLLYAILQLPGLGRIRLSGIEPMCFDHKLLSLAEENANLAPHFHIPLQSGSARLLSRMGRPYQPEQYLDLVLTIRERLPQAAIGADVMVGFPGETEEEHAASLRFVGQSPLNYLHVFSYSARDGTEAARWSDLPPAIVRRRSLEFRSLAARKKLEFEQRFIGSTVRALTLQAATRSEDTTALAGNNLRIVIPGASLPHNQWVDVLVRRITEGGVFGSVR